MTKVLVTEQHLMDIASAIREKLDSEDTYRPGDMAAAIRSIEGGYPEPTGVLRIAQNGLANVKDYAAAEVDVQPNLQQKTATQNGTVTPDQGYDGLSSVEVNVSGSNVAAFIRVYYAAGNTVTCGNGTITLTSDTSGEYVFEVSTTGTWTVTSGTYTETVNVDYGYDYSVTLDILPNTSLQDIRALIYYDHYDVHGHGDISAGGYGSVVQHCNYIATNDNQYYVPTNNEKSFTTYFVYQGRSTDLARTLTIYASENNPGKPCWFQENGILKVYDTANVDTSNGSTGKYVLSISRDDDTNIVKWYINGQLFRTGANYSLAPAYVYFNGTGNTYRTHLNIYMMSVVYGAESDLNIVANHAALMQRYEIQ